MARILLSRAFCWIAGGFLLLHFLITQFIDSFWTCPIHRNLHVPCPGCGMTRSAEAWLDGQWMIGLQWHWFGPVLFLVACFVLLGLVLPRRARRKAAVLVGRIEQNTGITTVVVLALFVYWAVRLTGYFGPPGPF